MKFYKSIHPIYRKVDSDIPKEMYRWFHENQYATFTAGEPWGDEMPFLDEEVAGYTQFAFVVITEREGSYDEVLAQALRARSYGLSILAVYKGDPDNYPDELGYACRLFLDFESHRFYRLLDNFYSWARLDYPWNKRRSLSTEIDFNFFDYCDYYEPEFDFGPKLDLPFGAKVNGNGPLEDDLTKLPHLWVYGKPGSGRLHYVNSFILNLLRVNDEKKVQFAFFDPRKLMHYYDHLRGLFFPVAREQQELWDGIYKLEDEMHRRLELLDQTVGLGTIVDYNRKVKDKLPYIVAVVDQLQMAQMSDGVRIVSHFGQAVGIHFIIITETNVDEEIHWKNQIEVRGLYGPVYVKIGNSEPKKHHRYYLKESKFLECIARYQQN